VQKAEAVDPVGRAIGKGRIVFEGPALLPQSGNGIGDADRVAEFFQCAKDLRAVRPRAGVGDIEMIAAGFGLEAG
jgi:hypothetical protein